MGRKNRSKARNDRSEGRNCPLLSDQVVMVPIGMLTAFPGHM
jgi:hypothetical protein